MNEPYLSDNPFRLLDLDALTHFPSVRRKADSMARQIAVGIMPEVPFADQFGVEELSNIATITRGLAPDPIKRTAYRLFWLDETEALSLRVSWTSFLENPNETKYLDDALTCCQRFLTDENLADRLSTLLADEDHLTPEESRKTVRAASHLVARHVIGRASERAVEAGRANHSTALMSTALTSIMRSILYSPLDDEMEEAGIRPIIWFGDEVARRLTEIDPDSLSNAEVAEAGMLDQLAEILSDRHPSGRQWRETVEKLREAPAWRLREEAIDHANDKKDYQAALDLLDAALSHAVTEATKQHIRNDITDCRNIYSGILRGQAIACANNQKDFRGALNLLKTALSYAATATTQERIRRDISECRNVYAQSLREQGLEKANQYQNVAGALDLWEQAFEMSTVFEHRKRLARDMAALRQNVEQKKDHSRGCGILGLMAGLTFLGILYLSSLPASQTSYRTSNTPTPTPYSPPTIYASDLPPTPSPSPAKGSDSASEEREQRQERLNREYDSLSQELKSMRSSMEVEKDTIKNHRASLDRSSQRIREAYDDLDRYEQASVDRYNRRVRNARREQDAFNETVESYNRKIEKEKRIVQRINQIADILNTQYGGRPD